MIGPRFRAGLRVIAYLLLVAGVVSAVEAVGFVSGEYRSRDWLEHLTVFLVSVMSGFVPGAVLLTLLSIDQRLEARA
jgi:hypothetical protein